MSRTEISSPAPGEHRSAVVLQAGHDHEILLPDQSFVANSELTRDGFDLVLTAKDGSAVVIENYFAADPAPVLMSPQGAALTPDLVQAFVHQAGNVQFAAAGTATDESPVGTVKEVSGHATVTHPDGTTETIVIGMPIHEGDIIETDAAGAVNITFVDESSFAVSENAKLAIDQYVFDPHSDSGESNFSMLRGLFVYTSGLIGREDPDDVKIETPVGSIGIRGTVIAGNVTTGEITVMEGAIVLRSLSGEEVTLSGQYETAKFDGHSVTQTQTLNAADISARFSSIGGVAPGFFSGLAPDTAKPSVNDPSSPGAHDPQGDTKAAPAGETHQQTQEPTPPAPSNPMPGQQGAADAPAPATADFSAGANTFGTASVFADSGSFTAVAPVSVIAAPPAPAIVTAPPPPAPVVAAPPVAAAPPPVAPIVPPAPLPPNAPPVATDAAFTLNENSANGMNVGRVIATDPDSGQVLTYSISGGNTGNAFAIDANTGLITVAGSLDYETQQSYALTVTATDNGTGSLSATAKVNITLNDVNDAPIAKNATFSVAENANAGTVIGAATSTEVDVGQSVSYAITAGNPGGIFSINTATGVITLTGTLDYETTQSYNLTVRVTDNAGTPLSSSATITVNVTDINDLTPAISGSTFSVNENSANGTAVGTATATDGDTVGTLSYSITGGTGAGLFTINSSTGAITVNGALDYEAGSSYNVTVQVSDGIHTASATYAININDLAEPLSLNTLTVAQGIYIKDNINEMFGGGFIAAGDLNNDGYDDGFIVKDVNDLIFELQGSATPASTAAPGLTSISAGFTGNNDTISIAHAGDFNGDGVADIIIGAPHANDFDGTTDTGQIVIKSTTGATITTLEGLSAGDLAGMSVTGIGDVNHDGYEDVLVGAPGSDIAGTNGGAAYILFGGDKGVINPKIDVTSLNTIRIVGSEAPASPTDFVINGNYSYVVSQSGNSLSIIDLTNPGTPVIAGSINSSDVFTAASVPSTLDGAQAIAVQGNYAYIASGTSGYVTIINISNPGNPTYVGSIANAVLQDVNDIAVRGTIAVVTSATTDMVTVLNITTPTAPAILSSYGTGISDMSAVTFSPSGQYVYIGSSGNGRLVTLDISTPSTPAPSGTPYADAGLTGVSDMFIDGNRLYVTDQNSDKLFVFDITNQGNPSFLGSFTSALLDGASGVVVSDGLAYVTAVNSDRLVVVDVRIPTSMSVVNSYSNLSATDGASAVSIDSHGLVHVTGQLSGAYSVLDVSRDGIAISGLTGNSHTGTTVSAAGDFNNDGIADFAIASPGTGSVGRVDIVFGAKDMASASLGANSLSLTNIAVNPTDQDFPVFFGGDINGDGIGDIMIAAGGGNGGKGLLHVIYGSNAYTGGSTLNVASLGSAGYTITTGAATQEFIGGGSVGDFNGDGKDDLAVIVKDPGSHVADIYVVFGGNAGAADGTMTLAELNDGNNAFHMTYTIPGTVALPDDFDFTISAAGDVNGDGFSDFIVGLPNLDTNQTADSSGNSNNTDDQDGESILVLGHTAGSASVVSAVTATANAQTLIGTTANDTMSDNNMTGIGFRSGAGSDIIGIRGSGFSDIDGGGGNDTIRYLLTSGTLDFSAVGAEKIHRIENLDLGGSNQTMVLTLNNIFGMLDSSDTGKLALTASGSSTTNTIQIDNMGTGSQTGATAAQIGALLGADHFAVNGSNYDFQFGASTLSIDKAMVDTSHVNIA